MANLRFGTLVPARCLLRHRTGTRYLVCGVIHAYGDAASADHASTDEPVVEPVAVGFDESHGRAGKVDRQHERAASGDFA